jgi:hypothetical protein
VKRTTQLTFTEDPQIEVVAIERLNQELTEAMKKLRTQWLGSRISGQ